MKLQLSLIGLLAGGVTITFTSFAAPSQQDGLSLAGRWRFALDRNDAGIRDGWYQRKLEGEIGLPGSLPGQGIGDSITTNTYWMGQIVDRSWFTAPEYAKYREPGNLKVPFWLQPEKYYAGAAWYQRDVDVPEEWSGKRVALTLERPHWETRVWIDGRSAGTNVSLSTPHTYDLGALKPGPHTLTIRVDNRLVIDVGENSHSVSDHTQGNWNGIAGVIELRATPLVWIDDVRVFPNAAKRSLRVVVTSTNATDQLFEGKLTLSFEADGKPLRLPLSSNYKTTAADLSTEDEVQVPPETPLWDEFVPKLVLIRAELHGELGGKRVESTRVVSAGLREIAAAGTQFLINGRKAFFRGTLECAIFPKTGHPPTDVDSWKRIIGVAKAHGLNLIRFHSWCPPEAAFIAADELGFYFHVEAASWANGSTTLGDGKPVDLWIYEETDRILKACGNHPSFVLMAYGNEPGGRYHKQYLAKWIEHFKAKDSRRLYTSGAGWPQIAENQFHVTPDPRIQAWGGGLKSRINARPPETSTDYRDYIRARSVPVISHEIGQWCVYPNFDEIPKYTGYLKPKNFEIFRDSLRAHGMGDLARQFLLASGKLQTLCYKEDIESALRTPGMGGFELLDLHDFPGQGTALVGVLDPFWESKGYVTAEEFSRFCGPTVPLARLGKRVFTTEEILEAKVEVAHFGAAPLKNVMTSWKLVNDSGKAVASGAMPAIDVPVDNGIALGTLSVSLRAIPAPARYKLVVSLEPGLPTVSMIGGRTGGKTELKSRFENNWDVWVYPARLEPSVRASVPRKPQVELQALPPHHDLLPNGECVFGELGMARRTVRAACSGAMLWPRKDACSTLLPPASARAGTSQRDVPTTYRGEGESFAVLRQVGRDRSVYVRAAAFPLPEGEGQGVGKRDFETPNGVVCPGGDSANEPKQCLQSWL
ncbi:MAG: hypothetical protein HY735_34040, partial [Verrucomicrobia bacterium]|nr:hypothetical protein [Verrucomicrobiota bacterium]